MRPLVPHDNDSSLRARMPQYLITAEVLDGLGVVDGAGPHRFTFVRPDGTTRDVTLTPLEAGRYTRAFSSLWHPLIPGGLPRRASPPYLANRTKYWWSTTLSRGRVAYLAYNLTLINTQPLAQRVLRLARSPRVRRVVIDLRHNPGGNNATYYALFNALRSKRINRLGRLVVLIGRTTFSAAGNFAADLDRHTSAVFVGETSGSAPNQYGDPTRVQLPETGGLANVATKYWEMGGPADARLAIEPQHPVDLRSADFFGGRDPVLAAALALKSP